MVVKTREERLFGAACLKLTLAERPGGAPGLEIYQGTLRDLGLTDEEVEAYLVENRPAVIATLAAHRGRAPRS